MSDCVASGTLERPGAPIAGTHGRRVIVDASPGQGDTRPRDAGLLTAGLDAGVLTNRLRRHIRRIGAVHTTLAAVADEIHPVRASTPRKEQP